MKLLENKVGEKVVNVKTLIGFTLWYIELKTET